MRYAGWHHSHPIEAELMDIVLLCAITAIAISVIAYVAFHNPDVDASTAGVIPAQPPQAGRAMLPGFYEHPAGDDALMDIAAESLGGLGWFRSKIAGVSFRNEDGTSRQYALIALDIGAVLHIVPDPDNPKDENAFAIYTKDWEQLGYLPRHTAEDMAGRWYNGERYVGVLLKRDFVGERMNCGAIIGLLQLSRVKAREYGLLDDGDHSETTLS
ncbi:hypothetical protein GOB94_13865 [Granulicella sp. 5B5]|uniref:HIRAN domain-containing protein n=1 Tax=Granulicella sp. 5B5 TaxID=1617967 RepID=UPI0017670363|nr:HIRAN domain-containing protein [Granulicella sp. 5B5]QMV19654.1 hypothetical protein GOB94_13865 [Granulicella sp. 5B5]